MAHAENVLLLGPLGVGKIHLAIGLERKVIKRAPPRPNFLDHQEGVMDGKDL